MHSDLNSVFFKIYRTLRINILNYASTFFCRLLMFFKKIEYGRAVGFYGITYFNRTRDSRIVIGDGVVFRSDRRSNLIGVKSECIITTLSKSAKISIGNGSGLSGVSIGAAQEIVIGNNVLIGANCLITDTDWHNINPAARDQMDPMPGKINIHDNVFIGYGSIILKNVTIGKNSVIGAGSVVTKDIPENVVAAGNPCRVIRNL